MSRKHWSCLALEITKLVVCRWFFDFSEWGILVSGVQAILGHQILDCLIDLDLPIIFWHYLFSSRCFLGTDLAWKSCQVFWKNMILKCYKFISFVLKCTLKVNNKKSCEKGWVLDRWGREGMDDRNVRKSHWWFLKIKMDSSHFSHSIYLGSGKMYIKHCSA